VNKRAAKAAVVMSRAAREQLDLDVAAFDARVANLNGERPLKPPPMRILPPVITAAQLELRKAKRLGVAA
jgi:hypothetical protein